ncbi:Predicted ATPase, AAA+ superfamily [gamma proteobacterium HdN1]|nr:Predicted ATPase, AAA+ superfamily [gamma proteobacterium HdN1]
MLRRSVDVILKEALRVAPVVLLSGARQVGKSTLGLSLNYEYRVFDDLTQRESALTDGLGYIAGLPKPVVLDEIQKVPSLLEGIKIDADKNRVNGRFLLTGSANILDMKAAKDTLAGRLIEVSMWPFSQKELNHKPAENLVDILFGQGVDGLTPAKIDYSDLLRAILLGGYPEIQKIDSQLGRALWFNSYISTYIERDIRDVGELRDINAFIRFFNILAPRSCGLLNKAELAKDARLNEATASNYLSMLEMIYQLGLLPPISSNLSKRFIKSPKLYMTDSGVYSHLLGIQDTQELHESTYKGNVFETFVYAELLKHLSYANIRASLCHYRTSDQKEIDFILERGEQLIAIEVKSTQQIKKEAFKHISDLQEKSKQKVLGIVLYAGQNLLSFSENGFPRYAVPLSVFF